MIAFLLPLATRLVGERFAKLAAWAFMLLLASGAIYAAYCWAWDRGRDHERARWEAASAKVEKADAAGDAAGMATATQTKGKVEDGNDRAKAAAAGSDDPLRAGLDSLRRENRGRDEAAR